MARLSARGDSWSLASGSLGELRAYAGPHLQQREHYRPRSDGVGLYLPVA